MGEYEKYLYFYSRQKGITYEEAVEEVDKNVFVKNT